jgi:hypothetical protein
MEVGMAGVFDQFLLPEDAQTAGSAFEPVTRPQQLQNYRQLEERENAWRAADGSPWKPAEPGAFAKMVGSAFSSEPGQRLMTLANFIGPGPKSPLPGVPQAIKSASNLPASEALVAMHNLTPGNLSFAERNFAGNLPVPSIGITKMEQPLNGFGEVSLVGSPNLAKPSRSNPVYAADGYTARFPDLKAKIPNRLTDVIRKDLLPDGLDDTAFRHALRNVDEMTDGLKRYKLDRAIDSPELMRHYLAQRGEKAPGAEAFEGNLYKADAALRERLRNDPNYRGWADDYVGNIMGQADVKVSRGFSDATGREKLAPFNLENVVKAMKGGADTEGFDYGMGNLRARLAPRFDNLKDVQANRHLIMPREKWEAQSKGIEEAIWKKTQELGPIAGKYTLEGREGYRNAGQQHDAMMEAIKRGSRRELDYQFNMDKIPPDFDQWLSKVRGDIRGIGTDYFEAKPQRAVGLREFDGALVPENIDTRTLDILKKHGINRIEPYAGQDRAAALARFRDLAFSAPPAVAAGAAGAFNTEE